MALFLPKKDLYEAYKLWNPLYISVNVQVSQVLEPSFYLKFSTWELFAIYDENSFGYVPIDTVVNDLHEIEANGTIQAPILHFLSTKIAEYTLDAEDVSGAFHFLVQSVRELEILQRERAAWDVQKIQMILISASERRNASPEDVLAKQSIALQNLTVILQFFHVFMWKEKV